MELVGTILFSVVVIALVIYRVVRDTKPRPKNYSYKKSVFRFFMIPLILTILTIFCMGIFYYNEYKKFEKTKEEVSNSSYILSELGIRYPYVEIYKNKNGFITFRSQRDEVITVKGVVKEGRQK